jgi:hypothetical protein
MAELCHGSTNLECYYEAREEVIYQFLSMYRNACLAEADLVFLGSVRTGDGYVYENVLALGKFDKRDAIY